MRKEALKQDKSSQWGPAASSPLLCLHTSHSQSQKGPFAMGREVGHGGRRRKSHKKSENDQRHWGNDLRKISVTGCGCISSIAHLFSDLRTGFPAPQIRNKAKCWSCLFPWKSRTVYHMPVCHLWMPPGKEHPSPWVLQQKTGLGERGKPTLLSCKPFQTPPWMNVFPVVRRSHAC